MITVIVVSKGGGRMKARIFGLGLAFTVIFGLARAALASEATQGQQLYMQYCSSCHGKDGKGDGPVARQLKIKVPDLTVLKKNNKGIYPTHRVMSSMDGSRVVAGHGDPKMPVWGEVFRKESEEAKYTGLTALLKERAIAEYIATLQR
jgi:mono/diheme cytochrome c family protein